MTSPTDWPPAIASHLAVMERMKENERIFQALVNPSAADKRRTRAQAQPRGDGGKFSSELPNSMKNWSRGNIYTYLSMRVSMLKDAEVHLVATIAERDAELTKLRAFAALAASICGMNNCNCPTAPKIRQALKDL